MPGRITVTCLTEPIPAGTRHHGFISDSAMVSVTGTGPFTALAVITGFTTVTDGPFPSACFFLSRMAWPSTRYGDIPDLPNKSIGYRIFHQRDFF